MYTAETLHSLGVGIRKNTPHTTTLYVPLPFCLAPIAVVVLADPKASPDRLKCYESVGA